jgi:hypothetical protein
MVLDYSYLSVCEWISFDHSVFSQLTETTEIMSGADYVCIIEASIKAAMLVSSVATAFIKRWMVTSFIVDLVKSWYTSAYAIFFYTVLSYDSVVMLASVKRAMTLSC